MHLKSLFDVVCGVCYYRFEGKENINYFKLLWKKAQIHTLEHYFFSMGSVSASRYPVLKLRCFEPLLRLSYGLLWCPKRDFPWCSACGSFNTAWARTTESWYAWTLGGPFALPAAILGLTLLQLLLLSSALWMPHAQAVLCPCYLIERTAFVQNLNFRWLTTFARCIF